MPYWKCKDCGYYNPYWTKHCRSWSCVENHKSAIQNKTGDYKDTFCLTVKEKIEN
jgi:hypothetical protein